MKRLKSRITWGFSFNPVTRVVKSKKNYSRKKEKQRIRRELKVW